MITLQQATEYLDGALGASLPQFIVQAAVDTVAAYDAALMAAYPAAHTRVLIQTLAVAILSCGSDPRRIRSQSAPSGASRSFAGGDNLKSLRDQLRSLDTSGVLADVAGLDDQSTLFMVVC